MEFILIVTMFNLNNMEVTGGPKIEMQEFKDENSCHFARDYIKSQIPPIDAEICFGCQKIHYLPKGNGLRPFVCNDCWANMWKNINHWKKFGLYAVESRNDLPNLRSAE